MFVAACMRCNSLCPAKAVHVVAATVHVMFGLYTLQEDERG